MAGRPDAMGPEPVGRSRELDVVGALIAGADGARPGALLITGDAGIGKTALVQHACSTADDSVLVLAGACLPMTSVSVPFLPIRSAAHRGRRDGVTIPALAEPGRTAADTVVTFDAWLDDACAERPVVLVIDDLHWADPSTLDLLMYLLAGPGDRRLAVIATIRSGDVGETHPLQRWLADVRRLPRVHQLTLGPIDRVATAEQVGDLLGAPPHQSLVEDVYTQTLGNPYLTRLVVAGLTQDARHLPPRLPEDLESFVLRSWRQLSSPTRQIAQIIAVGGRPVHAAELEHLAGSALGIDDLRPLLKEAADGGALQMAPEGTYWFGHPLDAEVLVQRLEMPERRRWHAAFADLEERHVAEAERPAVETYVAVARHHDAAGHVAEAYRWFRRAAEAVESVGGAAEQLQLLGRAGELLRLLPDPGEDAQELMRHVISAAAAAGAHEDELSAVEELMRQTDRQANPLLVADLLARRAQLQLATGRAFSSPDALEDAVRLSAVDPSSRQHAVALAELARARMWQDDPRATDDADRALSAARASDDPVALAYAWCAQAMVATNDGRSRDAVRLAGDAAEAAAGARDFEAFKRAAVWEANATEVWAGHRFAATVRRRREQATALGAPHAHLALLSAMEADSWLALGEWQECLHRLRVVLGSDPGSFADVLARLTAARLAARQGRAAEALGHLARADELFEEGYLGIGFAATRAEVLWSAGEPVAAFDAAMAGATSAGVAPHMCEWLVPLAARALADQVQSARDAGAVLTDLLTRVDDLATRFPTVIRETAELTELWQAQVSALDDWYRAEVGRARRDPQNGEQWERTVAGFRAGLLAWEEAYACWRGAESLLVHEPRDRERAAWLTRRGLELAQVLGAEPLRIELAALATSARIRVDRVRSPTPPHDREPELPGLPRLTAREREILAHLVAGRTYGEIARTLVISEKTVSSHVSNLLRKTGTANRVELSGLATRAVIPATRSR